MFTVIGSGDNITGISDTFSHAYLPVTGRGRPCLYRTGKQYYPQSKLVSMSGYFDSSTTPNTIFLFVKAVGTAAGSGEVGTGTSLN